MDAGSLGASPSFELRHLRCAVAVADEGNFTRAAGRLHMAQQSLSETVAQLEGLLGFIVFDRSVRPVAPTPAGAAWLPHAREALQAATRASSAARGLAAAPSRVLRIGLAATSAISWTPELVSALHSELPQVTVEVRNYDFDDPTGGLDRDETDVALVRPPVSGDALGFDTIFDEPRYVVLPAGHRFAGRTGVAIADIADEPWFDVESSDPAWCAFWRLDDLRNRPARRGARGRTLQDLLEASRACQAVGIVPRSVARTHAWPGLAYVEVLDAPPSAVAVAWRLGKMDDVVQAFLEVAHDLRARSRTGAPLPGRSAVTDGRPPGAADTP